MPLRICWVIDNSIFSVTELIGNAVFHFKSPWLEKITCVTAVTSLEWELGKDQLTDFWEKKVENSYKEELFLTRFLAPGVFINKVFYTYISFYDLKLINSSFLLLGILNLFRKTEDHCFPGFETRFHHLLLWFSATGYPLCFQFPFIKWV